MSSVSDESVDQIGCIDGSVLRVTRHGTEVHLHIGDNTAPLSQIAAKRLSSLCVHAEPGVQAEPNTPTRPGQPSAPVTPSRWGVSGRMGEAAHPTLVDLLAGGFVNEGTVLALRHHGAERTATVTANGRIAFDGHLYDSPSGAAKVACGGASVNGWTAWKLSDGSPIGDRRWLFRADDFPGEGHRYAPSTAKDMRRIARRWVDYARTNRLDPAEPSVEVEAFLRGHGYSESTLAVYRNNLLNWQHLYGSDTLIVGPGTSVDAVDRVEAPSPRPTGRMGEAADPTVADLLGAGFIGVGTKLTLHHLGSERTATVTATGQIEFEGDLYLSLSGAAMAACEGASTNGWTAWKLVDGSSIDTKRWLYRADDFPGEGHRYALSSAHERRTIARRWVVYALSEQLDPAEPRESDIEALLDGHGYSESTLRSYRGHLSKWRQMYGRNAPPIQSASPTKLVTPSARWAGGEVRA